MVSRLSPFNPYSLLHIPLYGVLAILIIFSIHSPLTQKSQSDQPNPKPRLYLAGLMASGVALADEAYQSFIPSRHASLIDIFLNLFGIAIGLILFNHFYRTKLTVQIQQTQ